MHLLLFVSALLSSALADDSFESLISNGDPAKDGDFPYQVGLKIASTRCGGALISTTYILTAARCVDRHSVKDITAYVGSVRFGKGNEIKPKTMLVHPDYDPKLHINDLALLKINTVTTSKTIATIDIQNKSTFLEARISIASGWGQTGSTSKPSPDLQYARLFVYSNSACAALFSQDAKTFSYPVLCAGAPDRALGCVGDWGGPLMFNDTKQLIGIMSSGSENCSAESSHTTVFTTVFKFKDWILKNIKS